MIIDATYFNKGELFIPNNKDLNAAPVGAPSQQSKLDFFIEKYERELLLNALGATLYRELETALEDLENADQKWQDLVNGKDYAINGLDYIWDGLKGNNKQSVIAFYVFCQYLRNDESTYTTTGIVKNSSKNAEPYNPSGKYVKVWESFLEQYQNVSIYNSPTITQNAFGSIGLDYYSNQNTVRSLYQFLMDSNELDNTAFPDFKFKAHESINTFGV